MCNIIVYTTTTTNNNNNTNNKHDTNNTHNDNNNTNSNDINNNNKSARCLTGVPDALVLDLHGAAHLPQTEIHTCIANCNTN